MAQVIEKLTPRNRRFVVKNCQHCGKEFGTDTPWRKHCGWSCTYDHMQALKKARRTRQKEQAIGGYQCAACKAQKASLAVYVKDKRKGVCDGCAELVEKLEFDKGYAYRLAYVIETYFSHSQRKASRQGRA